MARSAVTPDGGEEEEAPGPRPVFGVRRSGGLALLLVALCSCHQIFPFDRRAQTASDSSGVDLALVDASALSDTLSDGATTPLCPPSQLPCGPVCCDVDWTTCDTTTGSCVPKACGDPALLMHLTLDQTILDRDGDGGDQPRWSPFPSFDLDEGRPPASLVRSSADGALLYEGAKNFNPVRGTVLLWLRPDSWQVKAGESWSLLSVQYPAGEITLGYTEAAGLCGPGVRVTGTTPLSAGCQAARALVPAALPEAGSWHTVAWTYDTSPPSAGSLPFSTIDWFGGTSTSSICAATADNPVPTAVWVGGRQLPGFSFDGLLDEVMVFSRVLAAEEIDALRTHLCP